MGWNRSCALMIHLFWKYGFRFQDQTMCAPTSKEWFWIVRNIFYHDHDVYPSMVELFAECKEMTACFCCCEVYGGFGKCGGKGRILKQENREWLKLDMWWLLAFVVPPPNWWGGWQGGAAPPWGFMDPSVFTGHSFPLWALPLSYASLCMTC